MKRTVVLPYVLPCLLLVSLVSFVPIIMAVRISLYETRNLRAVKFVGFEAYERLLEDPTLLANVGNSLTYTLYSLVLSIGIGLLLAVALNRDRPYTQVFRTLVIAPWLMSQAVAAVLWLWLLNSAYGPVPYLIRKLFDLPSVTLVESVDYAMPVIILVNVWISYPLATVLLLAALKTIPAELHEAAQIDGAGTWKRFQKITLPLLYGTLLSTSILLTLQFFNMVTLIYVMTGGGPLNSTEVLSVRVFQEAFVNYKLGYASTVGMVIFALNLVFSLAYIRILRSDRGLHQ